MAGILAWRYPAPGLFCFLLLLWLDMPRQRFFACKRGHALTLLAAFAACWCYAAMRQAEAPVVPGWLERAVAASVRSAPVDAGEGGATAARPVAIPVSARVAECAPLPGKRLRVILTDIAPLVSDSGDEAAPLPSGKEAAPASQDGVPGNGPESYAGGVVWTWNAFDPRSETLLPGQRLKLRLRFLPLRSFANPGLWSPDSYWHDRGVYFRALASGKERPETLPSVMEEGDSEAAPPLARLAQARWKLERKFLAALPREAEGQAFAVLPALVFGDRSLLTAAQMDLFSRSTLAHSLALSGLHMGFAVLAGLVLARALGALFPAIWLRLPRPGLALLCSLPPALAYLWLGQSPVSLQRAACMLFFWTLLFFLRKPRALLDGLFAALACILAVNPFALFDLSLQLSAVCIAVLALSLPAAMRLSARLLPMPGQGAAGPFAFAGVRLARGACVIFCTSLCIQIALLPLTVRAFGSSGLLFPLNILWLPLLGTVVLPFSFMGLLAAGLGLESVAALILHAASLPCHWLLVLLERLDRAGLLLSPLLPRPHWLSSVGYWLLCLALAALCMQVWKKRAALARKKEADGWAGYALADGSGNRENKTGMPDEAASQKAVPHWTRAGTPPAAVLLGLVLLLAPGAPVLWDSLRPSVQLRLLDVGQGQSVLVEWSGLGGKRPGGRVLIDGGGLGSDFFDVGKAVVSPLLTDNRLPRLYAAFNSHPDRDHLEGLLFILEHFAVERYFGNGDRPTPGLAEREVRALAAGAPVMERLARGDRIELAAGLVLEVVWPPAKGMGGVDGAATAAERVSGRKAKDNRNDNSLVLRLVWQGRGLALIPGDVGKMPLRSLAGEEGPDISAQVLVLPHHGSGNSLDPAFYKKARAGIALASCGTANAWRYPAPSIRKALRDAGVQVYSTAERGQIAVSWSAPEAEPRTGFALPSPDGN